MSGPETHLRLNLREISEIGAGLDALDQALSTAGTPTRPRHHHLLAVEEVIVNALTHCRQAVKDGVTIDAAVGNARVVTTIEYPGPVFDLSDPAAILPKHPERIGGHGLRLLHAVAERLAYAYVDGINVVTLSQRWTPARCHTA